MDISSSKGVWWAGRVLAVTFACVALIAGAAFAQTTTVILATQAPPGSPTFVQQRILLDRFEAENPDIKVDLQYIEGYGAQVLVRIAGGSPPDVFWVGNNAPSLASQGFLYDLTGFIERDQVDLGEYIPSLVEAYTYNGRVYGLPNDSAPHIFYYNRGLLELAGIDPGTLDLTWSSLVDVGKKLTIQRADGEVEQWGFSPLYGTDWVMSWVWQNEGSLLNTAMTEPAVNTPEFAEAVEYLYNLKYEYQIAPPIAIANSVAPHERFAQQNVAILQQGAWLASTALRDVDFDWGMLLPPKGKTRATGISYGGFSMPYNTEHPEEAWRLLKFITGEEGQKFLIRQGYAALAAHRTAIQDQENLVLAFGNPKNPNLELDVIVESALISRTLPNLPVMGEIGAALADELSRVWNQETPVQSALFSLDQRIRAILNR